MPIRNAKYRLTRAMVDDSPESQGIVALFQDDELIYIGRTATTIRARLQEVLDRPDSCAGGATHYSWELSLRPAVREAELIAEYLEAHGQLPRCNDRAA